MAKNRAPPVYYNTIEQILLAHIYQLVKVEGEGNDAGGFESGNDEKDYVHVYEDDEDEDKGSSEFERKSEDDEGDYDEDGDDNEEMEEDKDEDDEDDEWMRISLMRTANATVYEVSEWKQ